LGIKNSNYFVDSNSLELIERRVVKGDEDQHVAANFYPVTSMIGVRDGSSAMTILTDRPLGGASI